MFSLLRLCFVCEIYVKNAGVAVFVLLPCQFIPSHYTRRRFPLVSTLVFGCSKEIPSINQKLTFDEIISCITGHEDFSPRSHQAVSLQVAPFLRDCKGRGYRRDRRARQTEQKKSES